jgi:hypothetical protein
VPAGNSGIFDCSRPIACQSESVDGGSVRCVDPMRKPAIGLTCKR